LSKVDSYRQQLRQVGDWDSFLLAESRLPGPRGNIELARAVAEEGEARLFWRYLHWGVDRAPVNTPPEFLAFCGTLGLGRLLVDGDVKALTALRSQASDPRWRIREAVAMALQRWGEADLGPSGGDDALEQGRTPRATCGGRSAL